MVCKTQIFIEKAKVLHGDTYDYTKTIYLHAMKKVIITCKIHGDFECTPNKHLTNRGCRQCGIKRTNDSKRLTTLTFIDKANTIHNKIYDYSLVEYKQSNEKVIIVCGVHGKFECTPNNHLRGKGCPICKLSKGEIKIKQWLDDNNIVYTPQKRFDDCRNKRPLPFDFYLPDHHTCIEYDGKQHFNLEGWSTDEAKNIIRFQLLKQTEKIKDEYCSVNNIHLIRIPYYEFKNIETIMKTIC